LESGFFLALSARAAPNTSSNPAVGAIAYVNRGGERP
jgi:hypothetical protein